MLTRSSLNPTFYAEGATALPVSMRGIIDERARFDTATTARDQTALGPDLCQSEPCRQPRQHLVYDGNPPLEDLDVDR